MAVEKDTQGSLEHPPDHALIAATVRWEELPPELLRHLMRQLCPPQLLHLSGKDVERPTFSSRAAPGRVRADVWEHVVRSGAGHARAVCRQWREAHDGALSELLLHAEEPTCACVLQLPFRRFVGLTTLQLVCDGVLPRRGLAAALEELAGAPTLRYVHMALCSLADDSVRALCQLEALHTLRLQGCDDVTDAGLAELPRLPALRCLSIECCPRVRLAGMQLLGGLALTELEILGPVHLHDDSVRALSESSALRALRLVRSPCDHKLSQVSDEGMRELARCSSLTDVALCGFNAVTAHGIRALRALPTLTALSFEGHHHQLAHDDEGVRAVAHLESLTSLCLEGFRRLSDDGLLALASLPRLRELTVEGANSVSEAAVRALRTRLPALRTCYVERASDDEQSDGEYVAPQNPDADLL